MRTLHHHARNESDYQLQNIKQGQSMVKDKCRSTYKPANIIQYKSCLSLTATKMKGSRTSLCTVSISCIDP